MLDKLYKRASVDCKGKIGQQFDNQTLLDYNEDDNPNKPN